MPFLLAMHSELNKSIQGKQDVFSAQTDAIWLIHTNLFRIMLMLFFRLMTIDMSLFQFIDWFLEQFDEEDDEAESTAAEIKDTKSDIKMLDKLQAKYDAAPPGEQK